MTHTGWDLPLLIACASQLSLGFFILCFASVHVRDTCASLDTNIVWSFGAVVAAAAWLYPPRRLCTYFEIIDSDWLPTFIKNCLQENMFIKWRIAFAMNSIGSSILYRVEQACVCTKETTLVALGAGGGGIEPFLLSRLRRVIPNVSLVLTDIVPNVPTWQKVQAEFGPAVSYIPTPVDATKLPAHLSGIRILTGSLHHLPPPLVTQIFQDAIQCKQPIIAIDGVPNFFHLFTLPASSFCFACASTVYLLVKAITSSTSAAGLLANLWRLLPRLLLTLTCVLPLIQAHDMFVSVLRFYGEADMQAIIAATPSSDQYTWQLYYPKYKILSIVVGMPKQTMPSMGSSTSS